MGWPKGKPRKKVAAQPKQPKQAQPASKPNGSAHGVADPFPDRSQVNDFPPTGLPTAAHMAEQVRQQQEAMTQARQLRPVLTLFATANAHVLRIDDMTKLNIALAVGREIKSGSLIVITPTDTRVFDFGNAANATAGGRAPVVGAATRGEYAQPVDNPVDDELEPEPMDDVMATAPMEMPTTGAITDVDAEMQAAIDAEMGNAQSRSRVRHRETQPATPNSLCGRCGGNGTTVGGGTCPVCQGRGTMVAWGRRPSAR